MKRKLAMICIISTLAFSLTACGNSTDATTPATNETEEASTEEVATTEESAANITSTEKSTPEPVEKQTPEPTEEPKNEFTKDIAEAKVAELFNARNDLFKNGKVDTDLNFLVAAETLSGGIKLTGITTADAVNTDEHAEAKWATVANYFYDYVNNESGYYNLGEYLTSHTYDEIIDRFFSKLRNESVDTDIVTMLEAPGVLPYLLENLDNLSFGDLVSGEDCTAKPVSGIEVYYEMAILLNGEKCGVTAVFDKSGMILNLITVDEDGWTDDNYKDSVDEVLALEN